MSWLMKAASASFGVTHTSCLSPYSNYSPLPSPPPSPLPSPLQSVHPPLAEASAAFTEMVAEPSTHECSSVEEVVTRFREAYSQLLSDKTEVSVCVRVCAYLRTCVYVCIRMCVCVCSSSSPTPPSAWYSAQDDP